MKRLATFSLLVILLVSTCGVNVSVRWCGGEWIGVTVNGVHLLSETGRAMGDCCSDEGAACDDCHHVSHHYQVSSQFLGAQGISLVPPAQTAGWLLAVVPPSVNLLQTVEEGSDGDGQIGYATPFHEDPLTVRRGLRAPPALV